MSIAPLREMVSFCASAGVAHISSVASNSFVFIPIPISGLCNRVLVVGAPENHPERHKQGARHQMTQIARHQLLGGKGAAETDQGDDRALPTGNAGTAAGFVFRSEPGMLHQEGYHSSSRTSMPVPASAALNWFMSWPL